MTDDTYPNEACYAKRMRLADYRRAAALLQHAIGRTESEDGILAVLDEADRVGRYCALTLAVIEVAYSAANCGVSLADPEDATRFLSKVTPLFAMLATYDPREES